MRDRENKRPKHVEELENFPFENFEELKRRVLEGVANIGVDRGIALQWALRGIYSPRKLRIQLLFLSFLPLISITGFIIYAIVTKNWLLLLLLPILLISFFILHPSSAAVFGFIRNVLLGLTFTGLIWGFAKGVDWVSVLSLSLAVIWYALRTIYRKAVVGLIKAALEHEDLLCILWNGNALNVTMYNGDSYWVKWKTEGGRTTYYDSGNTHEG